MATLWKTALGRFEDEKRELGEHGRLEHIYKLRIKDQKRQCLHKGKEVIWSDEARKGSPGAFSDTGSTMSGESSLRLEKGSDMSLDEEEGKQGNKKLRSVIVLRQRTSL